MLWRMFQNFTTDFYEYALHFNLKIKMKPFKILQRMLLKFTPDFQDYALVFKVKIKIKTFKNPYMNDKIGC